MDDMEVSSEPVEAHDMEDEEDEVQEAIVVQAEGEEEEDDDDQAAEEPEVEAAVLDESVPAVKKKKKASTTPAGSKKKVKSKKKKKKSRSTSPGAGEIIDASIPPERRLAARDARSMLQETVPSLPVTVGETTVRSFGRLCVEPSDTGAPARFATPKALYPVGFSCDRFEFSPVHGRVLKMRCSILDGRKIKKLQQQGGYPVSEIHDGPVFRVMWGRGVDEDGDGVEYPFEPRSHAEPIVNKGGTTPHFVRASAILPEEGMRVKVRFSEDQYFCGTVTKVGEEQGKKKEVEMTIRYDDGSIETLLCPDPDVAFVMPGAEEELNSEGGIEPESFLGKPVVSVVGQSPLEVWGNVLVRLGMIDEIMLATAMEAVHSAREEALQDAREKLDGRGRLKKCEDVPESGAPSPVPSQVNGDEAREEKKDGEESDDPDREEPSLKEKDVRVRVESLMAELESAKEDERAAAVALADARIAALGPFMCNPFHDEDDRKAQNSWIATAIRKEKTRMGSTGNRKKVVTALDLLERNDTIYNADVEALIEGLPGSESCNAYIFQAFRSGGAGTLNRSWIHEAELRQEKEALKRVKRNREAQVKEEQEQEREKKRLKREEVRDAKKRQKMEEEDEKKRARIDERMSRLRMQVEDRLLKEAAFQREKAVSGMARGLSKELVRRRKAAELVAGQMIVEMKKSARAPVVSLQPLPPLSKTYDEDTIRVWNFVTTFKDFFLAKSYMTDVPTLDSLQAAVDCLRGDASVKPLSIAESVSSLTELAIALCQPLAASLTRVLFASLIALNPTLQKDFGAAFFNEVNSTTVTTKEDVDGENARPDVLLPVNATTWQEVARVSFLSDALGELGYQRHEIAHILRGYRSAGHPNSKEARRLRRAEDFAVALLRQRLAEKRISGTALNTIRPRMNVPCTPLCYPSDCQFYIHVVRSTSDTGAPLRDALRSAIKSMSSSKEGYRKEDMEQVQQLLDDVGSSVPSKAEEKILKKARSVFLKAFGSDTDASSIEMAEKVASNELQWPWDSLEQVKLVDGKDSAKMVSRQQMGLLSTLSLTQAEFKTVNHEREDYMEDALTLKEDMERQKIKDDDDDDDDDEEEDEDDEGNGASSAVVVENGTSDGKSSASGTDTAAVANGNGADEATTEVKAQKIGKETPYDDFCADIPTAPELIRRCLAVLRTLSGTGPAEPFLYPVDPQTNPGYYDMVLRPMCLREAGKQLQEAAARFPAKTEPTEDVEEVVVQFGRNVRLIAQNCLSYANAGPTVISAGTELVRIFERLFLEWVLAPSHVLPALENLDDDRCVEMHPSDDEATVLLCDGCEGKYNITRLNPPLREIPKGDWYCPRCVSGRWWGDLDPRIGKTVRSSVDSTAPTAPDGANAPPSAAKGGIIRKCHFRCVESADAEPSLLYVVECDDGSEEFWSVEEVDRSLKLQEEAVPPIRLLKAVAESPGYGFGVDNGLRLDLLPTPLHPNRSDSAARVAITSSVFRDTINASGTLLVVDPQEMTASEWLRLLVLLVMKCSSSDVIQNVVSKMESEAAEKMAEQLEKRSQVTNLKEILPELPREIGREEEPDPVSSTPVVEALEEIPSSDAPDLPTSASKQGDVVVEAKAVEVVDEMDTEVAPVSATAVTSVVPSAAVEQEKPFAGALTEKAKRQKMMEDSFVGFNLKNQLRPTLASFEEDTVSEAIDSVLSSKTPGLDFQSLRSRHMECCFCGLTDTALGMPLVRVPNEEEWNDAIPHAGRERRLYLVAQLPTAPSSGLAEPDDSEEQEGPHVAVTIRLSGELLSVPDSDLAETEDGGMLEFCPRSEKAFQHDLKFRDETGLPFVTGSLSAHECCAVAAHNSRKELMIQKHREHQAELVEKEAAMSCGRTLEIGRDCLGRSFWKFHADPEALYVCLDSTNSNGDLSQDSAPAPVWHRFPDPESIASVVVSLGKDAVVKDLRRAYPAARELISNGTWSELLLKRKFGNVFSGKASPTKKKDATIVHVVGGFDPYEVGEKVLVESKSGSALWDAEVTAVSRRTEDASSDHLLIDAYRVRYKGWSTRFVEWVEPNRIVEPNENNRLLQDELFEEQGKSRFGLPPSLNQLNAATYLMARDRARGNAPLPDFARIASVDAKASSNETTMAAVKAALLAIEAALPVGSINNTTNGAWRPEFADQWKLLVQNPEGPGSLMRCVIILEDTISEEWIKEDVGHLRSCLPARWKAVGEASPSALALRISLLDRSVKYEMVDRRRFSKKKKR